MAITACPGEPYFANEVAVCDCLDFQAIAAISLDARWAPEGLAAVEVRDADLVIDPLLRRAADLGHVDARLSLSALHASGAFVDCDDLEVLRWYREATETGHPEAAYHIVKYLRRDMPDYRKTHAAGLINEQEEGLPNIAASDSRSEVCHLLGALRYERGDWKRGGLFECHPDLLLIKRATVLAYRPAMQRRPRTTFVKGSLLWAQVGTALRRKLRSSNMPSRMLAPPWRDHPAGRRGPEQRHRDGIDHECARDT